MVKNRRQQLLDEFCDRGQLEEYRQVLDQIFNTIYAVGVKISARYDVEFSNFEAYDNQDERIRISLKNVDIPLDVIWILFHEFGHFQSDKKKPTDTEIYREELAWGYADITFGQYPELSEKIDSYELCKKRCLNTYYRKHNFPELK